MNGWFRENCAGKGSAVAVPSAVVVVLLIGFATRPGERSVEESMPEGERRLEKKIEKVRLEDVSFEEAVRWLSQHAEVEIEIDKGLATRLASLPWKVTIVRDEPLTARQVLDRILATAMPHTEKLEYLTAGDRVIIVSGTFMGRAGLGFGYVRVYEVGDLLKEQMEFWRADPIVWGPQTRRDAARMLRVKLRTRHDAEIRELGDRLAVRTSLAVHRQIEGELAKLRGMR